MQPRIFAGDAVTLEPAHDFAVGDVVLVRVGRRRAILVLHQVLAAEGARYLIGNASGREDGWVEARDILGKATRIERAST
jgi:hypothetical protein